MKQAVIQAYHGFANNTHIYAYGRALFAPNYIDKENTNSWQNFKNSIALLNSKELANTPFLFTLNSNTKEFYTNTEGYYKLQEPYNTELANMVTIQAQHLPNGSNNIAVQATHTFYKPLANAKFVVVSDVDDTVLYTHVLNKWKLILNSLFTSPFKRLSIKNAANWYTMLQQKGNLISYISNSPWNFYNPILTFLKKNNFPIGPILLRDFGAAKADSLQQMQNHKYNEVENLLHFYPNLPFILIGDGGEKDAAIYVSLLKKYPTQVKYIFIYRLGNAAHQQKIAAEMQGLEHCCFFITYAQEAIEICLQKGIL
jgi:phosphatidate phosphatase APP1